MFYSDRRGQNAFLCSAEGGKQDQLEYFILKNHDISYSKNFDDWNALHISTAHGNLECCQYLVDEQGFQICCRCEEGDVVRA